MTKLTLILTLLSGSATPSLHLVRELLWSSGCTSSDTYGQLCNILCWP